MKRIIAMLCAAAMLVTLTGCGKKGPADVVDKFCGAARKFDVITMSRCMVKHEKPDPKPESGERPEVSLEDIPMDVILALREHAKTMTYEIGEVTESETTARVPVVLTYPDLSVAVGGAIGEYLAEALGMTLSGASEEELEGLFQEILARNIREAKPRMRTADLEFNCVMTGDGWKIQLTAEDVINMLIGNIMQSIGKLDVSPDDMV